jgi:hypothetical protein
MKLKMKEIILIEQRPFSFADFREFEIGGKKYQMGYGTFRNSISRLKKRGEVEPSKVQTFFLYYNRQKIQQNDDTRPYWGCQMPL